MRVASAPTAEQDAPFVTHQVAIAIHQQQRVRCLLDDHALRHEAHRSRNRELVGVHDILFVHAIAIFVDQYTQAVAPLARGLELIGIVQRLAQPQPAITVKTHGQRLADARLSSHQINLHATGHMHQRTALLRRERLGHGALHILAAGWLVERHARRHPLDHWLCRPRPHKPIARRPAHPALDEVMKARVHPRPRIVSPSRVEDTATPFRTRPGPRLITITLTTRLQQHAIRRVPMVHIGFVLAGKRQVARQCGMRGPYEVRGEVLKAMALELRSY